MNAAGTIFNAAGTTLNAADTNPDELCFICMTDLSMAVRGKADLVVFERPARGLKMKKPSAPGKTENEGIRRTPQKTVQRAGLILLFVGEVTPGREPAAFRLAQPNRYPDFRA